MSDKVSYVTTQQAFTRAVKSYKPMRLCRLCSTQLLPLPLPQALLSCANLRGSWLCTKNTCSWARWRSRTRLLRNSKMAVIFEIFSPWRPMSCGQFFRVSATLTGARSLPCSPNPALRSLTLIRLLKRQPDSAWRKWVHDGSSFARAQI